MASTQPASADELRSRLLLELFREAGPPKFSTDRRRFRATHHEHLKLLDEMVNQDEIRDRQDRYSPALLALSTLQDSEVQRFLDDCNLVVGMLRDRYLENQSDMVSAVELAERSGGPRDSFMRALAYLNENSSLLAGSQGVDGEPLAKVLPSEKALVLKDVSGVLTELRHFRALRAAPPLPPRELPPGSDVSPASRTEQERPWLGHLPADLQALLPEIYAAHSIGLRSLVAMGVRAAVDMTCNHLVGDLGGFDVKLEKLRGLGHISERQQQTLHAVVQLGHASAHRGHVPGIEDAKDALDILERALKAEYVDPHTTQRLKKATPARR